MVSTIQLVQLFPEFSRFIFLDHLLTGSLVGPGIVLGELWSGYIMLAVRGVLVFYKAPYHHLLSNHQFT